MTTEWLCKFCRKWNKHFHRYCGVCLAAKTIALKEER